MIRSLGNQRSSWMDYKRWESSINDIPKSQNHWRMFSEDVEPKGGDTVTVLRRYEVLENKGGYAKEGVEEMVLWKSGDVRRCGGSGEIVAV